ncbi:MAG: cytochrome P450 [Alphaproteobacteria bacterium]
MQLSQGHRAIEQPAGVLAWDVDPYDPAILSDPTEYYAELRAKGPFAYLSRYQMLACGRYHETREVFSDWQRFVSSRGVGLEDYKFEKPWRPPSLLLEVEPPYHDKTRFVAGCALSPKAVGALKGLFASSADRLIDELMAKGTFEAIADLAEAYPATVFPPAIGLQRCERQLLVDYGKMVFNAMGPNNELRRLAMAKAPDVVPWIALQCRRENLAPDGHGALIYAAVDRGEVSEQEAGLLVRSLLTAGMDTTIAGIGNTLWCLATNPDQYERLKAEPSLARHAFEEALRYTSPVHSFCRTAHADTVVSGIWIEADTKILCVLGAANLDEDHWPEASRFDIGRKTAGHLALGVGIHGCVGQNLARAETIAMLTAIATRVDSIELAGDPIWQPGNSVHALARLPITFKAK